MTTNETANDRGGPARQIFLRPLANPLPLGFIGLAGASLLLTGAQVGWLNPASKVQLGVAVVLVAFPLQSLASVFGFLTRDPVASTSMGTLAIAWLTTGVFTVSQIAEPGLQRTAGLLALFFAAAVLLTAVVAAFGNGIAAIVLVLAAARFALTGVQRFFGATTLGAASGWLGLAVCVVALYAALALAIEHLGHRPILPTLRRGMAAQALTTPSGAIGRVEDEPGVRSQL